MECGLQRMTQNSLKVCPKNKHKTLQGSNTTNQIDKRPPVAGYLITLGPPSLRSLSKTSGQERARIS